MLILSIETSCDETAAAVTENGRKVLADIVLSQADLHKVYGGVVPEIASRRHAESISQLADMALEEAGIRKKDINAVAVTYSPGLIGALLVGVNFSKAAAMALGVPIVPVHHICGHVVANYIAYPDLKPPFICLAISGGNTLLADVRDYTDMRLIGATADDAAGECFDKVAGVLGLGYPGGKPVDEAAKKGDDRKYRFPRALIKGRPYDMSFSGLKTSVINLIRNAERTGESLDLPSLCASFCAAVSDSLVSRTISAAKEFGRDKVAVAGGVAANLRIRRDFESAAREAGLKLYIPPPGLCGDNAAGTGCQAYYEYLAGNIADIDLNAAARAPLRRDPD